MLGKLFAAYALYTVSASGFIFLVVLGGAIFVQGAWGWLALALYLGATVLLPFILLIIITYVAMKRSPIYNYHEMKAKGLTK
jgi:hypothetical protein